MSHFVSTDTAKAPPVEDSLASRLVALQGFLVGPGMVDPAKVFLGQMHEPGYERLLQLFGKRTTKRHTVKLFTYLGVVQVAFNFALLARVDDLFGPNLPPYGYMALATAVPWAMMLINRPAPYYSQISLVLTFFIAFLLRRFVRDLWELFLFLHVVVELATVRKVLSPLALAGYGGVRCALQSWLLPYQGALSAGVLGPLWLGLVVGTAIVPQLVPLTGWAVALLGNEPAIFFHTCAFSFAQLTAYAQERWKEPDAGEAPNYGDLVGLRYAHPLLCFHRNFELLPATSSARKMERAMSNLLVTSSAAWERGDMGEVRKVLAQAAKNPLVQAGRKEQKKFAAKMEKKAEQRKAKAAEQAD